MATELKSRRDKQTRFLDAGTKGNLQRRRRVWLALATAAVLMVSGAGALWAAHADRSEQVSATQARDVWPPADGAADVPPYETYPELAVVQSEARLPLTTFADGQAHFYRYMNGDQAIGLFAVRDAQGVLRVAFDACDVCYRAKRGYWQDGDMMVCGNCGNRFPIAQIGLVQGGCNPAPLAHRVESDELVIGVSDIVAGAQLF